MYTSICNCLYIYISKKIECCHLSITQTEDIVIYPVRAAFRNEVEGLREHLRILFFINLFYKRTFPKHISSSRSLSFIYKTYKQGTGDGNDNGATARSTRLGVGGRDTVLNLLERKGLKWTVKIIFLFIFYSNLQSTFQQHCWHQQTVDPQR
jgi:hypothetical protein